MGHAKQLRARIGRRGAALLAFAFVDFVIAFSLIDPETRAQTSALPAYKAHLVIAPIEAWGAIWLVIAASCLVHAFLSCDQVGFALAIGIKLVWAAAFAASWLFYDSPRGWVGAATWAVVASLVVVISGWPEPSQRVLASLPPSPPGGGQS